MTALFLKNPFEKILVVGPVYDRVDIYNKINEILSQYDYVIFNGGLNYSSGFREIVKLPNEKVIYCIGRNDLITVTSLPTDSELSIWIRSHPNIVIAEFKNRNVMIMDGGIPSGVKERIELLNNLEISFVSQIQEKPWHQYYGGKWGYVISNNPLTTKYPQYYTNSLQIGNSPDGLVYAQEVDEIGLKQLICL